MKRCFDLNVLVVLVDDFITSFVSKSNKTEVAAFDTDSKTMGKFK